MIINKKSLSILWFYLQSYRSMLSENSQELSSTFLSKIKVHSPLQLHELEPALKTEFLTMLRYPNSVILKLMSDISTFIESFSQFEVSVPPNDSSLNNNSNKPSFNSIIACFSMHSLYHLLNNIPQSISTVSVIGSCEEHLTKLNNLIVDAINHGEYYVDDFELSVDGDIYNFRNLSITYRELYDIYCKLAGERVHLINSTSSMICYLNDKGQPDLFKDGQFFV